MHEVGVLVPDGGVDGWGGMGWDGMDVRKGEGEGRSNNTAEVIDIINHHVCVVCEDVTKHRFPFQTS